MNWVFDKFKYLFSNSTTINNESNLANNSNIPILGRNYNESLSNLTFEDYNSSESTHIKHVLREIGKEASQLNDALDNLKIIETNQQQLISLGNELINLTTKLRNINTDEAHFEAFEIGKEFAFLQKNLKTTTIDDDFEFTLVLSETIDELERVLNKLKTNDDTGIAERSTSVIAEHAQSLNTALSSINVTVNENSKIASNLNLSPHLNVLEEKIEEFKNILYKRLRVKYQDLYQKLKKDYNFNLETIKQSNNINYELKAYVHECIKLKRSKAKLKILLREKFKFNDLDLTHYFKMFLVKYEKQLFKFVLSESGRYLPKSELYTESVCKDKQYHLLKDTEQFELIHQFLVQLISIDDLNEFYHLVKNKTETLELFFDTLNLDKNRSKKNHLTNETTEYYLNSLKECFLLFTRDFILNINDHEDDIISNEKLNLILNQLKEFNHKQIKIIQNLNQTRKYSFLRKCRGQHWNNGALTVEINRSSIEINQLEIKIDIQVDKLKTDWLKENVLTKYLEYENYVLNMKDSSKKSIHLYELSNLFYNKTPNLKIYLKKAIDFIDRSIAIDQFVIKCSNEDLNIQSTKRTQLREKYELRGLIHLKIAQKFNFVCFEMFDNYNKSKEDFIQYENLTNNEESIKFDKNNYIILFKKAFQSDNATSIDVYNSIIKINPYFFEAHYQKLLLFYELKDCTQINDFNRKYALLSQSKQPIISLFQILTNRIDESVDLFVNRTLKVKVKNNQRKTLYLKLLKSEHSYQFMFNNEDLLVTLLKNGKSSMVLPKLDDNLIHKLTYHLSNYDFKQLLLSLNDKIDNQEANFSTLIKIYKDLKLINETKYQSLNIKFKKLLPETRLNLIKLNITELKLVKLNLKIVQSVCCVSKAINEYKQLLNETKEKNEKKHFTKRLIELKTIRAKIYCTNKYHRLEELELIDILKYQKNNSNPVINYRLSYLNLIRGDLQQSTKHVNFADKKYYDKSDKKIFTKTKKLRLVLNELESTQNNEMKYLMTNKLNLLQISNLISKLNLESDNIQNALISYGIEWFTEKSLLKCLFYHLVDENKIDYKLLQKYNELLKFDGSVSDEILIAKFNTELNCSIKGIFLDKDLIKDVMKSIKSKEIPIILVKNKFGYSTTKNLNRFLYLTMLLTNYNAKNDLKKLCALFLNDQIIKNTQADGGVNEKIEQFMNYIMNCDHMKTFSEEIIFYLQEDDYNEEFFNFWSLIADLDYNIDLKDTVYYFKQLFVDSIEECRQEREEHHKSSMQLLDDLIQQYQNEIQFLKAFVQLKEQLLDSLSIYTNVSPNSAVRQKFKEILLSNSDSIDKLKRIISSDCFNIALKLDTDTTNEEEFFNYLNNSLQQDTVDALLPIFEEALAEPKIVIKENVINIEGYNIFFSKSINDLTKSLKNINEIKFCGTNIFIDESIKHSFNGINLVICAKQIEFLKDKSGNKIIIDVTGKNGEDGKHAEHQSHATRPSEDGLDGLPGQNGKQGQNGGNIYLIADTIFKGKENIEKLITSGGDGGKGGNGGNAGNGSDGKNGEDASEENTVGFLYIGFYLTKGTEGTRGGDGGVGGNSGLGAYGGHAGVVHIEENQTLIHGTFSVLIESKDKSSTSADDGKPGEGGTGGVGGVDGSDVLFYKTTGFAKNKKRTGYIRIKSYKVAPLGLYLTLDYEYIEKPKKKDGINNINGKKNATARNKSETKNKSNENQIKNQLNQYVNKTNQKVEQLNEIINNSLNLLKDQLDDKLDELNLRIRANQQSDSLIQTAHQIAQQALLANSKTNVKIEQTILKGCDDENMDITLLIQQSKLKIDEKVQEIIRFEKNIEVFNQLENEFETKLKEKIDTTLKQIKQVKNDIKDLKSKGKNISFRIDAEDFKTSFLISKNKQTEVSILNLDGSEAKLQSNELTNYDLSQKDGNYQSVYYDSVNKSCTPVLLQNHFAELSQMKQKKAMLISYKNRLLKMREKAFRTQLIYELCIENGSKQLIDQKKPQFYQMIFNNNINLEKSDFNLKLSLSEAELTSYANYLKEFNFDLRIIQNILIESNISLEQIKKSENLLRTIESNTKLKEFTLNECSPIYHKANEELKAYQIEMFLNQYIESKEPNIELLFSILKSFVEMFKSNEYELLCQNKVKQFVQFLVENLLFIKIDYKYGHLLNLMKRDLNFIQLRDSSLFNKLFNELELVILIRETQFKKLKSFIQKINDYFNKNQNDVYFELKVLNYIRKNKKTDVFKLFSSDFNTNIDQFVQELYLNDQFKFEIKNLLVKFNLNNNNNLKQRSLNEFQFKLGQFLTKEKNELKEKIEILLIKKDKLETLIQLLSKNINILTNIDILNEFDTLENTNVEELFQAFQTLYDKLRLKEIEQEQSVSSTKEKQRSLKYTHSFNDKICHLLLISRDINNSDIKNITTGRQIILQKQNKKFTVHYRDKNDYKCKNFLIPDHKTYILNSLKFNDVLLDKKLEKNVYKLIYQQVNLNNGFTQYTIEQIEVFYKLEEVVNEKLKLLKDKLVHLNMFDFVQNEIDFIFKNELPDLWPSKTYSQFNIINTILILNNKFNNKLNDSKLFKNVCQRLNVITFSNKTLTENVLELFYNCLVMLDYMLSNDYQLDSANKDKIHQLIDYLLNDFETKNDSTKFILEEILQKTNIILNDFYLKESIRTLSAEQKSTDFKQIIDDQCKSLYNHIDEIFSKSSDKLNIFKRYLIYAKSDELIKKTIKLKSIEENSPSFAFQIETFQSNINYIKKHCLILISRLEEINSSEEIKQNLNSYYKICKTVERCSLRVLSSQNLKDIDQYSDDIVLNNINQTEIKIIYKSLIENKTEYFILKRDQDQDLFQSLIKLKEGDLTEYKQDYDTLYFLIKSKNGVIHKYNDFFEKNVLIKTFLSITKNKFDSVLEKFLFSFEIILQNTNLNPYDLVTIDDECDRIIQSESDSKTIELFQRLSNIVNEKYQQLINGINVNFTNLASNAFRKNRILNVMFNYLKKNLKEKGNEQIKLDRNDLLNVLLELKTVLEKTKLPLKSILSCLHQLNKHLIETPFNCLEGFKNQLNQLRIKSKQFIENIDYSKEYEFSHVLSEYNIHLNETNQSNNEYILVALKGIVNSPEVDFASILNKILFNLKENANQLSIDFLSELETQVNNMDISFRKDFFEFINEQLKQKLRLEYDTKLDEYKKKLVRLNNSIKEILDSYWSNVSLSDLLNKEREKTYLNLNIIKLLNISNELDNEADDSNLLNDISNKIKELQLNPNKKEFTNDLHSYLNLEINKQLSHPKFKIDPPFEIDKKSKESIKNILSSDYKAKDSLTILEELSLLFEMSIDKFKDKTEYNEFFNQFFNVFKYFSWRIAEFKSDSKDASIQRISTAIKTFKELKIDLTKYNRFDEFENLFNKRKHDNQLQEELSLLIKEKENDLILINEIFSIWMNSFDEANDSITLLAKDYLDKLTDIFVKNKINSNKIYKKNLLDKIDLIKSNKTKKNNQDLVVPQEQLQFNSSKPISLEEKYSVIQKLSQDIIDQEKDWHKKKQLITNFNSLKSYIFDEYTKQVDSDKFHTEIKHFKEIITETNRSEWNQEIEKLLVDYFANGLLKLYGYEFNQLKTDFNSIESMIYSSQDEILIDLWQSEIKEKDTSTQTIEYILKYSNETNQSVQNIESLDTRVQKFIQTINLISDFKISIDALYFFVGYEQFGKIINIIQAKIIDKNTIKIKIEKLVHLLNLLSKFDDLKQLEELLMNNNYEKWFLYLYTINIEAYLKSLFDKNLDSLQINQLEHGQVDELIEIKFNQTEAKYNDSMRQILNNLKYIELNPHLTLTEKETFFSFIQKNLLIEHKQTDLISFNLNNLESVFIKYLSNENILRILIDSLTNKTDNSINEKTFQSLVPYLDQLWIIEELELDKKVLKKEKNKIVQYLELIKVNYSEEIMFQLIDVIKLKCQTKNIIPQGVIDLLKNISNNNLFLFNSTVLEIMRKENINEWELKIDEYIKEKTSVERNADVLINLMKEDSNGLNKSIKEFLSNEDNLKDLKSLLTDFKSLTSDKSCVLKINDKNLKNCTKYDIKKWASLVKGNKLLSDKNQVKEAILVVSQAIYLFNKFYPRETQIIALWLFLNPDLNVKKLGCLAQISTGEGKSIIVAGLAAIKALSCHKVDIITSSNILAIRDSEQFAPFFSMFNLQVSNNCDILCEQGDGIKSTEEIRKLRYCNEKGPVDIIYGECSCFERDILLTEFNQNDPSQNITSQRMTGNSVSSVIIDEVDSMLLDKANMVLYLSHGIDTLKSLERVLISIWQLINQESFDKASKNEISDDLVELVSDIINEKIDSKQIEIPEYSTSNCDYINMKQFVRRRIPIWVRSAFHVKEMIPNDTYIISRDKSDTSSNSEIKITVMDKDTGTEQLSTRWSNGVHQFLQLKHMRRLTPETLKAVFISNMTFFKRYKHNVCGLTGTLGSIDEQNLLEKVYNLRFFQLPRFRQERFRQLNGSVFREQENWLEGIKNALDREIKLKVKTTRVDKRRAVLIICENVKSVLILKDYLSISYPNAHEYKSSYEKFEIDKVRPGDVIIATNLAGRGTDLETSAELEENGGLHVISAYFPSNIRVEMQAFGRTSRKGNKGTGEYIIHNKHGLSIEILKQFRNQHETERLNSFLLNDLPRIKMEEDLLHGFDDDSHQSGLSCIGFKKLYQQCEEILSDENRPMYVQFQLYSLKNRWAFWLDSMSEQINMVNIIGKKTIIDKFNQFKETIERDIKTNDLKKLIIEPSELIKLGKYYRDIEDWSKALICYREASKDPFYSYSNYYAVTCEQNINFTDGLQSKRKFKHNLIDVKVAIEKELQFLNSAAQVALEIGEKNRKLGSANYGNEYSTQVKEKVDIWNIFLLSITNAIGSEINPKNLTTTKYLCNEKDAEQLFKTLETKQFIKPIRITKNVKQIDLPALFNNDLTREQLFQYLNEKSNERKKSKFRKLDNKTFKSDLKSRNIFLPYLKEFVKLLQKKEFEFITKTNEELFAFKVFDDETLRKVTFPSEISDLKESLISCLKEAEYFTGKQDDLRNQIKTIYLSKNEKPLEDKKLDSFYQLIYNENYLETVTQYSVNKDKIVNKKLDFEYNYLNIYDFERHYTENFKKFEPKFRNTFLKAILIQEDNDGGDSYITLKETVNSNEFDVSKTDDDAIDYLWGFLRSNKLIKEPRVNIGLISSKIVKTKSEEIKKEIQTYFEKKLNVENKSKELNEAVNSVFGIIEQTIGDLKKIPDDKTITSYLEIKTQFFLNNKKAAPEGLNEFIELALDVVFRLEEKKDPPKWYEIAAVITLGVFQVVAGVLAKAFIPVAGQLIGEFLISTGCDDIMFGVQCAISGEFNWEKYWEHKKQSMITAAITAVVFVGVSYLKNASRLKSFSKANKFAKLTGANKLRIAADKLKKTANVWKYVGKEIGKTLVQTGLSKMTSLGINAVLEGISNGYELELEKEIKKAVNDNWSAVKKEMQNIFLVCDFNDSKQIIEDCIKRKLQNISTDNCLKNFANNNKCSSVMQGLGKAFANSKGLTGTITSLFTTHAPMLINLGVSAYEIVTMISNYMKSLVTDLEDTRKKLSQKNQNFQMTQKQSTEFENFQSEKMDQIAKSLSQNLNDRLKNGIIAPVLNFGVNHLISKGIQSIAGADRIEQLANTFELIHAAANAEKDTKTKYLDSLAIFLNEAKPFDLSVLNKLNIDPKDLQVTNIPGASLQKCIDLYGKVKVFVDKNGKIYVQRPSTKEYCESVRGDKPAGEHEQKKIAQVLSCEITKGEQVNGEQKCSLTRKDGKKVEFVVKENEDGTKHAEILIGDKSFSIETASQNKNDCFYNVALVANEMSKGETLEGALKAVQDGSLVKELREDVSIAMKNDEKLLNEFRWGDSVDLNKHFNSLTGMYFDPNNDLRLDSSDVIYFRKNIVNLKKRPDKFRKQKLRNAVDENGNDLATATQNNVSDHHIIPVPFICDKLKEFSTNIQLSDTDFKNEFEKYLNDPRNSLLKSFIKNESPNLAAANKQFVFETLIKSVVFNPNNLVYGPVCRLRLYDPTNKPHVFYTPDNIDRELISAHDKLMGTVDDSSTNIFYKLTSINDPAFKGTDTWHKDQVSGKFFYKEDTTRLKINNPFSQYKTHKNDNTKIRLSDGTYY